MATKDKPSASLTIPEKFKLGEVEVNREYLLKQVEELCKLTIDGVSDIPGYKLAVLHRASFRTTRVTLEKVRKEMSAPHQEYVKKLKEVTDDLGAIATRGENYFDDMIKAVDTEKERIKQEAAAAAQRKLQSRSRDLITMGATFDGETYSFVYDAGLFITAVELFEISDAGWGQFNEDVRQAYATEQERLSNLALEEQARIEEEQAEATRVQQQKEANETQAQQLKDKRSNLRLKELKILGIENKQTDTNVNFVNQNGHRFCDQEFLINATDEEWESLIVIIETYEEPPTFDLSEEALEPPHTDGYSASLAKQQEYADTGRDGLGNLIEVAEPEVETNGVPIPSVKVELEFFEDQPYSDFDITTKMFMRVYPSGFMKEAIDGMPVVNEGKLQSLNWAIIRKEAK